MRSELLEAATEVLLAFESGLTAARNAAQIARATGLVALYKAMAGDFARPE